MKKVVLVAGLLAPLFCLWIAGCASEREPKGFKIEKETVSKKTAEPTLSVAKQMPTEFKTFPIYTDDNSPDNNYIPSGWMGDYSSISYDSAYMTNCHGGSTCIQITYGNRPTQGAGWSGIYWQNPANNWGMSPGGFDLSGAKKLVFWVRGEEGGERIEEFKVGGITGEYPDTDVAGIGPVLLTQEWKQYEIDLEGRDLSRIAGGFAWSANLEGNPDGMRFYLDDIRFE